MTGIEDYSGFEVIRAAMEVEKNGHQFYSAMVEKAKSSLAKEIFTWLAQDEVQHLRTLKDLVAKYEEGAFWADEEESLPYLRRFSESEIFPSSERLAEVLQAEDAELRAFDLAIEAEEKFAAFFKAAASKARNEEGREAFTWLAGEEDRHASLLKERKARILAG